MNTHHPLFDAWDRLIEEQIPNFLRLHLNPFVVQTCLCLSRYVQDTWDPGAAPRPWYQTFPADACDGGWSGVLRGTRWSTHPKARPKAGLVLAPGGRRGPWSAVALEGGGQANFPREVLVAGGGPAAAAPPP